MATLPYEAIKHVQDHLGIYHYKSYFTLLPFLEQAFLGDGEEDIKNCPNCQNFLGMAYCEGSGVVKDIAKGISLIEEAAKQGYAKAQYNLSYKYEFGSCVEMDLKKAHYYCKVAADQGYTDAVNALPRITRKYNTFLDVTKAEENLR